METKEITGIVEDLTVNSLKVNRLWYRSFNEDLIKGIIKGNKVNIQFTEKEKDGKIYKNIKLVKILPQEIMQTTNTIKDKLDTTTLNTLLMCIKEIYIKVIDNEKDISINEVTNEVIEAYKQIKKELN